MSDSEWEQLLASSPRDAYEYLIENYGNLIYAIVINKLGKYGTKEDIEDCVSDIMVEFLRNAGNFSSGTGSLKSYISTVAKYRAIDAFRRLSWQNSSIYFDIDDENVNLPPSDSDTEEEAGNRIFRERLWSVVQSLGEPDSSIIIYQYFYNQKVSEIAHRLGMTSGAVQKRSLRARKKIGTILENGEDYE
ncbi:MAG: sigma-70 family RNA polymerase sigma factor [Ruminococcus flavefaciens]|nr:sigma-70 family RNA polymerase sigma factor [Ruminococcus flavefaciens]